MENDGIKDLEKALTSLEVFNNEVDSRILNDIIKNLNAARDTLESELNECEDQIEEKDKEFSQVETDLSNEIEKVAELTAELDSRKEWMSEDEDKYKFHEKLAEDNKK